jgi:hypothetical protein
VTGSTSLACSVQVLHDPAMRHAGLAVAVRSRDQTRKR